MLDRVLATNTKSVAFAFKYQLPAIEKSGGRGSMLVDTSCAGSRVASNWRGGGVYSASKAAANMLAQYAVSSHNQSGYSTICTIIYANILYVHMRQYHFVIACMTGVSLVTAAQA
jgi:NAD(P)-dependent dehydrogenase (short-subunit alcohol dehydrogenase family)